MAYGSGARREGEEETAEERGEQGEEGGSGKASDGGCTAARRCPAMKRLPCFALIDERSSQSVNPSIDDRGNENLSISASIN